MSADFSNLPALILAAALTALLVVVLVYAARASQPGPEGPSGPPTGTAAMERKVAASSAMILGLAVLALGYGLREPTRQAEAQERLLDVSVARGVTLYTALCYSCHGEQGQGAKVPDSDPVRVAPPLNRPDFRPTDPDERKKKYDFIAKTIQRGRPNTPMPPWGQTDGGTLFDEQINELALMILNGDRPIPYEGRPGATPWVHAEHVVLEHVADGIAKKPEQPEVESMPFYADLNDVQKQGVRVVLQRGCGGCHVIPNIPGAAGTAAPSLAGVGGRTTIAGTVPNTSVEELARWIQNPQAVKPGTGMPNLGLSADEARAAAEYLFTLKSP